jgi:hypothetical protein
MGLSNQVSNFHHDQPRTLAATVDTTPEVKHATALAACPGTWLRDEEAIRVMILSRGALGDPRAAPRTEPCSAVTGYADGGVSSSARFCSSVSSTSICG